MTTRFYFNTTATPTTPALAYDGGWELTASATRYYLQRGHDAAAFATKGVAETSASGTYDVCILQGYTDPLSAQTLDGTVKGIFRTMESASGLMHAQTSIRVVSPAGTVRGTAFALSASGLTSEFATTLTNRKFPLAWAGAGDALTSTAITEGDRIIIELGYRATNIATSSMTGSIEVGALNVNDLAEDETSTNQYCGWIEFSKDLIFIDAGAITNIGTNPPALITTSSFGRTSLGAAYNIRADQDYPSYQDVDISFIATNVMTTKQYGMNIPGKTPTAYRMIARDPGDTSYIRWTSFGAPDWAGVYAGVPILAGSAVII